MVNPAEVPVIGLADVEGQASDIAYELRKRGFIITAILDQTSTAAPAGSAPAQVRYMVALALSPRLVLKQAVEHEFPLKDPLTYDQAMLARIAYSTFDIIERSNLKIGSKFLLHDQEGLDYVLKNNSVSNINDYFGSQIAIYFAWVKYYTRYLVVPAVAGTILFARQVYLKTVDTSLAPLFNILIAVWGTLFLEFWKRENNSLSFVWGVEDAEENEEDAEIVKSATKPPVDRLFKYSVTVPINIVLIALLLRTMLYFIWLQDHAEDVYGKSSLWKYWPTVLYSVTPLLAGGVYDQIAVWLNDFEEHTTKTEYQNQLILKHFGFQFVNRYCALFYIAFWLQDLERLQSMLISLLITNQIINNFVELGIPFVQVTFFPKKTSNVSVESLEPSTGLGSQTAAPTATADVNESSGVGEHKTSCDPDPEPDNLEKKSRKSLLREASMMEYDVGLDYLELILQFGYVTMFAVAFPIAPLLALINNIFEYRVDLHKLTQTKRPPMINRSSLGAWYLVLEAMNFVSVLTNCGLVLILVEDMAYLVPSELQELLSSNYGKLVLVIALEHVLLTVKFIMAGVIDDTPAWIKQKRAIDKQQEQKERQEQRRKLYNMKVLKTTKTDIIREERIARLQQYSTGWSFAPITLVLLAATPYIISFLGLSMFFTLPVGLVFVSYLQAKKNRDDRRAACGIVTDPAVLKLVYTELPAWVYDSEVERVEWLNRILQKLWYSTSGAAEAIVAEKVQPILDAKRPPMFSSLQFRKVYLGNIPPNVSGIRVFDTEKNLIRLEVEFKWAGNAEFVLELGTKSLPMLVELANIQVTGKLRVELNPIVPRIPLFGAIAVTFMKLPHVDFSLKLGALDVMNIGAADYNMSALVGHMINSAISSLALFPKKIVVPIFKELEIHEINNPAPEGLLQLTVVSGIDMVKKDLGSSDPYVVIKTLDQHVKTKVVKNTVNPVFNFSTDLMIYDKATQVVELIVYDQDLDADDFMGSALLHLDQLPNNVPRDITFPLTGVPKGKLVIKATYSPLDRPDIKEEDESDVVFQLSPEELTDDLLSDPNALTERTHSNKHTHTAVEEQVGPAPTEELSTPQVGVLSVSAIRCSGLPSRMGWMGAIKPYVVLTVGSTTFKTEVRKGEISPSFSESKNFLVKDAAMAGLVVKVMDEYSLKTDEVIGEVTVRLSEIIRNNGLMEQAMPLEAARGVNAGTITMRIAFNAAV